MSYISAIRDRDEVRVWERKNGKRELLTFPAPYYFFTEHKDGEYVSLFGQKLMRHDFDTYQEMMQARQECESNRIQMFESDIPPELKVLSEHYYNKEAPTLNVTLLDIEVDYNRELGFSSVANPYAPVNSIAMYHTWERRMVAYAVPPFETPDVKEFTRKMNEIEALPTDVTVEVHFCRDEKQLLLYVLAEIEESDLLSGWNCIPTYQSLWTENSIITMDDVTVDISTFRGESVTTVFPRTQKRSFRITTSLGQEIETSLEHRLFIKSHPIGRYTDLENLPIEELTVADIITRMETHAVFLHTVLRENNNPDLIDVTTDQAYLAGLIYTDGTLTSLTEKRSGYRIFQSDYDFLASLPLVETKIVGPHKQNYSRGVKRSLLSDTANSLIYDGKTKRLNKTLISQLSFKQFCSFLSGLLDGDGYVSHHAIEWCNYNGDIATLQELCAWNGFLTSVRYNPNPRLRFLTPIQQFLSLRKDSRWSKLEEHTPLDRHSKQKAEMIKFKQFNNDVFVQIRSIVDTGRDVEMVDIETKTHKFVTAGAVVHNCDFFDIPYLGKRIFSVLGPRYFKQLSFPLAGDPKWRKVEKFNVEHELLDVQGRITVDYLDLFRKYEVAERPSYKLESIADEILPDLPKLEYEGSLADLYRKDFAYFVRYNLRDTEILKGFEDTLGYIALANEMYHISTGLCKHVTGTLKLAELAINNYCIHELGVRVPDNIIDDDTQSIQGAYVLEPKVGLHEWIGSMDINSLYPSSIRSINISPETLVGQFRECERATEEIEKESLVTLSLMIDGYKEPVERTAKEWKTLLKKRKWAISGYGTVFSQEKQGVIPAILENWYATRKKFQKLKKEATDKQTEAYYDRLQYVYKIKLNSLYGALNNRFFRFYDLRMGESTTGTGRMILRHMCSMAGKLLDGDYNIKAPSVIYGDTDSCYFATSATNKEEAVKFADYVAEKTNETFQEFMQRTFLCNEGFDNIIKAGREVVSDRGIFVDKKRYILHVVDLEGASVDKLKVMGLDTKKTTLPVEVSQKLNKFVERFLKGESWDIIARDIVNYKEELRNTTDIMSIGLPKGVKGVEEYTNQYMIHGDGVRLPGHVAASIFYNECLKRYEDKDNLPIVSGMKIKVFYLSEKQGRFKSIALPTDSTSVPEWFLDHFSIDRDAHIERLVDNPLNNIIKAIGKDCPSKQSLIVEDLLEF